MTAREVLAAAGIFLAVIIGVAGIGTVVWLMQQESLEEKAKEYFDAAGASGSVEVIDCVEVVHRSDSVDDDQWCEVDAEVRVRRLYRGAIPIPPGRGGYCFITTEEDAFPVEPASRPDECVLG